jgi:alkanesulfonate monooxygenase SsuD/methylene tetrahydromethanopterin reductase-like flavin-dependent oxidoreductase (luciferase family)
MKVEFFNPIEYNGKMIDDWPTPPREFDAQVGHESIRGGLEQFDAAHAAGFSSLNLAEHHYSPAQMIPSPHMVAAVIGERLPNAHISLLGTDLPLHNPVSVAEQYATLDNMLGGRLTFALLRGTPNEYMTYGTNPWESRERFEEAVELVLRCLTEPEPFGWEGRYYRYRNISIFPGPYQKPFPKLLLSGNSVSSARFAGRMRADLGLSFLPPEVAAANAAAYREAAAEAGWEPTEDNILYRQMCLLDESDEAAFKRLASLGLVGPPKLFNSRNPEFEGLMNQLGAALAGVPKGVVPDMSKAPSLFGPPFIGGPQSVLDQIWAAKEHMGMGRVELVFNIPGSPGKHEFAMQAIKLAGQSLIPALLANSKTI